MIGYLIIEKCSSSDKLIRRAIDRTESYTLMDSMEFADIAIYFFKNTYKNDYLYETDRFVLSVTGTFVYKDLRGIDALKQLGATMARRGAIEYEYPNLHGPYTLVVCDKALNIVHIVTDREGLQHCFISRSSPFALSSSQLLLASICNSSLNQDAIREFIHIGTCFQGKTLFKNIERMLAATALTMQNGERRFQRLWAIDIRTPHLRDTYPQIVEKTWAMLESAVAVAGTVEPGRLVADLTGGTDSRTILSFLLRVQPKATVSAGGAAGHIDVTLSKQIAARLGLEHFWNEEAECPELTEGSIRQAIEIADGTVNPLGLLQRLKFFQERAARFDIRFGGAGGPLFKDHYWLFEMNRTGLDREPNWQRIANLSVVNYPIQDSFFQGFEDGILDDIQEMFLQHSETIVGTNNQKLDYVYFTFKVPAMASAGVTLANKFYDVYQPFLSGPIVEYMININPWVRKYNILQFTLVYKNNHQLAWCLTDTGVPAVPPVGKFVALRALFLRRYARSAFRKFNTFVLKRSGRTGARSDNRVAYALRKLGFFDLLDYNRLSIAPIVARGRLSAMLENPDQGSNQTYLMNTLAVELFVRRVEEIGGRPVDKL